MLYSEFDAERLSQVGKATTEPFRSPWRRDIARLLHCPSFRRLQAKTQVFPGNDSDFFRSRLTHSLEVSQIAKSIAIKLNAVHDFFKRDGYNINPDIVEFAALAHDLGHPPFGHNGEEALHEKMRDDGGFEGNAQTLHILTKVEKKEKVNDLPFDEAGNDLRLGLNLTYRSLASILKYDRKIAQRSTKVQKGYYEYDSEVVNQIKQKVLKGATSDDPFKTIECSIMDLSDDIAYSTYDLEDCFKAQLLTPLDLFGQPDGVKKRVVSKITSRLREHTDDPHAKFTQEELVNCLFDIFKEMFEFTEDERRFLADPSISREAKKQHEALQVQRLSIKIATDGYERVRTTSDLVQKFMDGVEIDPNAAVPAVSKARLNLDTFKKVEVLKNITYEAIIMSPRMRVVEYRGYDVIKAIFEALAERSGHLLLPDDYRDLYQAASGNQKKRVICDFIAGMTDRYAWQFYNRICGSDDMTIHLPV